MRDQVAETISMLEGLMDDNAQLSAEVSEVIEKRPGDPCLEYVLETREFLANRHAFYEEMIARLLAGAPVLLGR